MYDLQTHSPVYHLPISCEVASVSCVAGERELFIIECLCRRCYNLSTDAGIIMNYGKHAVET